MILYPAVATAGSQEPEVLGSPFSDVSSDHPNAREFALLHTLGVFDGYADGRVRPESPLTRAQFAKVAVCLVGEREQAEMGALQHPGFKDGDQISPVWWGWVSASQNLGLVRGYQDGSFRPRANITYAEAVAVLLRVSGYSDFLGSLQYPDGYIARARELGITEGVALSAHLPITRSEMARMAVNTLKLNPPNQWGNPADDHAAAYRPSLLETWQGRVEGFVSSVADNAIVVDGAGYTLASEIYLYGASSHRALSSRWVVAYHSSGGGLQYIETAEGRVRITGQLGDIDRAGGRLSIGGRWLRWIPDDGRSRSTRWQLNGWNLSATQALDRLTAHTDTVAQVEAMARSDWAEEIEALMWDSVVHVLTLPKMVEGNWEFEAALLAEDGIETRTMTFSRDTLPIVEQEVDGPSRVSELRPGDQLQVATSGGAGFPEDEPISGDRLYRVRVSGLTIEGSVARVEVSHYEGDLKFLFVLEDGSEIPLMRGEFLGGPNDMTLNDLYHADEIKFALRSDGYAIKALDARVAGTRSKYVKILTVWNVGEGGRIRYSYLVVDEAGDAVTYQLAHPSLWAVFIDDDLEVKTDRLVRIEVNEAGKCEGVVSWVEEEPVTGQYMVVFTDPEEKWVTLRRVRLSTVSSTETPEPPENEVLVAMEAAVYSSDGAYLGLSALEIGQRVQIFLDEADSEVAKIMVVSE